jgi:LysM repeat protein
MQRDIGNEIIVAIIVVGVLAFALTFGIILTLSNASTNNPNVAQGIITESSPTETEATAEVVTETEAASTVTHAETSESAPSQAPATEQASQPSTRQPDATHTASATPTLTATQRPALTNTPTHTSSPTPTYTPTSTNTSVPTATATLTATSTPTPAPSSTRTPTLTRTPTTAPANTATAVVCVAPFGWLTYTVQPGNTLASIAEASGTTVTELRTANCLTASASARIGDSLYVPRLPLFVTPMPTAQPGAALVAQGCTNPGTVITSPVSGQNVTGNILVRGTAYADDFAYYRIEFRPDTSDVYNFLLRSDTPVVNGLLGIIDSRAVGIGLNWLRVSVVDTAGNVTITPCAIPVFIQ